MDINTVLSVLAIAEKHMAATKFTAFRKELRTQYLNEEIAVREQYLAQKVKKADIAHQFTLDIVTLKKQLAAL